MNFNLAPVATKTVVVSKRDDIPEGAVHVIIVPIPGGGPWQLTDERYRSIRRVTVASWSDEIRTLHLGGNVLTCKFLDYPRECCDEGGGDEGRKDSDSVKDSEGDDEAKPRFYSDTRVEGEIGGICGEECGIGLEKVRQIVENWKKIIPKIHITAIALAFDCNPRGFIDLRAFPHLRVLNVHISSNKIPHIIAGKNLIRVQVFGGASLLVRHKRFYGPHFPGIEGKISVEDRFDPLIHYDKAKVTPSNRSALHADCAYACLHGSDHAQLNLSTCLITGKFVLDPCRLNGAALLSKIKLPKGVYELDVRRLNGDPGTGCVKETGADESREKAFLRLFPVVESEGRRFITRGGRKGNKSQLRGVDLGGARLIVVPHSLRDASLLYGGVGENQSDLSRLYHTFAETNVVGPRFKKLPMGEDAAWPCLDGASHAKISYLRRTDALPALEAPSVRVLHLKDATKYDMENGELSIPAIRAPKLKVLYLEVTQIFTIKKKDATAWHQSLEDALKRVLEPLARSAAESEAHTPPLRVLVTNFDGLFGMDCAWIADLFPQLRMIIVDESSGQNFNERPLVPGKRARLVSVPRSYIRREVWNMLIETSRA